MIEVWLPLALDPAKPGNRGSHYLYMVGRLKPDVSLAQARGEIADLIARWNRELPDTHTPDPKDHQLIVKPLLDDMVGEIRPKIRLLMGAVGLVLLIACVNVANLLLARAEARQKEVAVRTALGAPRGRLIRQFLTESVVLALLGGVLGLLLAYVGVKAIVAANLESIPRADEIGLDGRSVLFTLGISLLTGLLFGLAPALHSRAGSFFASLKEGGQRTTAGSGRQWLRRVLVVAEVAFAAMLVIGGGLLIRSFWLLQKVDPGFDPKGLLALQISLPRTVYAQPEQVTGFYQRLLDRARAPAGRHRRRRHVGPAAEPAGQRQRHGLRELPRRRGGSRPGDGPPQNVDYWQFVTRDYFPTMGIRLVDGRVLRAHRRQGLARGGGDQPDDGEALLAEPQPARRAHRVAGRQGPLADDRRRRRGRQAGGLDHKTGTELYFLHDQAQESVGGVPRTMYLAMRTQRDPMSLAGPVRSEIRRLDPTLPVADVQPMTKTVYESVGQPRFIAFLVLIFAIVALTLAAIGIYGVLAYMVELRTQRDRGPHGPRRAGGPGAADDPLPGRLAGGLRPGPRRARSPGAPPRPGERPLRGGPQRSGIFAGVLVVLTLVGFTACYLPAHWATRVDPLVALRRD